MCVPSGNDIAVCSKTQGIQLTPNPFFKKKIKPGLGVLQLSRGQNQWFGLFTVLLLETLETLETHLSSQKWSEWIGSQCFS